MRVYVSSESNQLPYFSGVRLNGMQREEKQHDSALKAAPGDRYLIEPQAAAMPHLADCVAP
jgi:hypothetical protein